MNVKKGVDILIIHYIRRCLQVMLHFLDPSRTACYLLIKLRSSVRLQWSR